MPQVMSLRPVLTPLAGMYMSLGNAYLKEFWISKVMLADHLPRPSPTMNMFPIEKFVFAGPPQRSLAAAVGPPPPPRPGAPAPVGARQPVVSPGPLPRKSLVWKYL